MMRLSARPGSWCLLENASPREKTLPTTSTNQSIMAHSSKMEDFFDFGWEFADWLIQIGNFFLFWMSFFEMTHPKRMISSVLDNKNAPRHKGHRMLEKWDKNEGVQFLRKNTLNNCIKTRFCAIFGHFRANNCTTDRRHATHIRAKHHPAISKRSPYSFPRLFTCWWRYICVFLTVEKGTSHFLNKFLKNY